MSKGKIYKATDSVSGCVYEWTLDENGSVKNFEVLPPRKPTADQLVNQKRFAHTVEGPTEEFIISFGSPVDKPKISRVDATTPMTAQGEADRMRKGRDDMPVWKVSDEELEALLFKYAKDLSERASLGQLLPVIGRDWQLEEATTILLQMGRSNVIFLGEPGVGKTAMFNAMATAVHEKRVPEKLLNARVIELDISSMTAGTERKAEVEERLLPIVKGIAERNRSKKLPPIIICLDEVHQFLQSSATGGMGVAETLKPYLTEGDLQIIGATTRDEYNKYIKRDEALDRRFQKIVLEEPNIEESIAIATGLKKFYERHHKLEISDECVELAVVLSSKFIRGRNQPDKTLMVLDGACAKAIKGGARDKLPSEFVTTSVAAEVNLNRSALEDEIKAYRKKKEEDEWRQRREKERQDSLEARRAAVLGESADPVNAQLMKQMEDASTKEKNKDRLKDHK